MGFSFPPQSPPQQIFIQLQAGASAAEAKPAFQEPANVFIPAPLMAAAVLMMAATKSNSHFGRTAGRRARKKAFSKRLQSLRPNLPDRRWTAEAAVTWAEGREAE